MATVEVLIISGVKATPAAAAGGQAETGEMLEPRTRLAGATVNRVSLATPGLATALVGVSVTRSNLPVAATGAAGPQIRIPLTKAWGVIAPPPGGGAAGPPPGGGATGAGAGGAGGVRMMVR